MSRQRDYRAERLSRIEHNMAKGFTRSEAVGHFKKKAVHLSSDDYDKLASTNKDLSEKELKALAKDIERRLRSENKQSTGPLASALVDLGLRPTDATYAVGETP